MSDAPSVISLGGGVQSVFTALQYARGEFTPMPVGAIFADTGDEPAYVYETIDRLAVEIPFPIHRVRWRDCKTGAVEPLSRTLERTSRGEEVDGRPNGWVAPPFFTTGGVAARTAKEVQEVPLFDSVDSEPAEREAAPQKREGMLQKQCTQNFKIRLIEHQLKRILGRPVEKRIRSREPLVVSIIGISWDEVGRVDYHRGPKWIRKSYPLVEDGRRITRQGCLDWLARNGWSDVGKSACVYCPYRSPFEWMDLKRRDPEGFAKAVEVDEMIRPMARDNRAGLTMGGELYVLRQCVPLKDADFEELAKRARKKPDRARSGDHRHVRRVFGSLRRMKTHWLEVTRSGMIRVACGVTRRQMLDRKEKATADRVRVTCAKCVQAHQRRG